MLSIANRQSSLQYVSRSILISIKVCTLLVFLFIDVLLISIFKPSKQIAYFNKQIYGELFVQNTENNSRKN